jgi:Kef-type K+ transport system membrane component KefB
MTLLLLQMTAVLLTALLFGAIARKFGHARVIGEIIGGICLGPSVFGRIAPHASASLFPQGSLGPFDVLSTVGLILFLFLIGTQLEYQHLRRHSATAALTSGMSILLPFLIAMAVAPSLHVRFAPGGVESLPFALFVGVSMSITAFPVLARILEERQMQSTSLGTTALMCAAVMM